MELQVDTSVRPETEGMIELFETVVQGGYCIGCGACAAVKDSPIQIRLDSYGRYQATLPESQPTEVASDPSKVCPFSDRVPNENEIGAELFGAAGVFDEHLGYHAGTYIGYVAEGDYRALGSSGGVGKWILCELLREGLVDAVIQVLPISPEDMYDDADQVVYRFKVARTIDEAMGGSKSVYYPVEMSEVLAYVRENPGRYAITAVPCFAKALRLLSRQDPVFAERITYVVGVICGHLKSTRYAEMMAWQFGIEPGTLQSIDFRKKLPGATAKQKGVAVTGKRDDTFVSAEDIVQNLFGTDYNHGFFQYRACDYCDDVVGETADISIGDAWLPEYMSDGRGTSVIVVRNSTIKSVIERAREEGRLELTPVNAQQVIKSQEGGFRQRREGLAYRLYLADRTGMWRPQKRVVPKANHLERTRKKIYRMRILMSEQSHVSFQRALEARDFSLFKSEMEALLRAYQELYRFPIWSGQRIKRAMQRRLQKVARMLA